MASHVAESESPSPHELSRYFFSVLPVSSVVSPLPSPVVNALSPLVVRALLLISPPPALAARLANRPASRADQFGPPLDQRAAAGRAGGSGEAVAVDGGRAVPIGDRSGFSGLGVRAHGGSFPQDGLRPGRRARDILKDTPDSVATISRDGHGEGMHAGRQFEHERARASFFACRLDATAVEVEE